MTPNIVVLTDFSPATEPARAYAAILAARIGAELHLVQVFALPYEVGIALPDVNARLRQEAHQTLEKAAAYLPVPATTSLIEADWNEAIRQILTKYRPLLLVAGLRATHGRLEKWLSDRTLPLNHGTGSPLLLVPEHLPTAALLPPRRLALAVEDRPFSLPPEATAVAPLLDALGVEIVTVTVLPPEDRECGWNGLRAAHRCGLTATMPHSPLHRVIGEQPATGILKAVRELPADVLVLLDPGHGWLNKLFHGSVIDQVLGNTPVPVLLLAATVTAARD